MNCPGHMTPAEALTCIANLEAALAQAKIALAAQPVDLDLPEDIRTAAARMQTIAECEVLRLLQEYEPSNS